LGEVQKFINEAIDTGYIKIKNEKIMLNPAVKDKLVKIQEMF
jgi:hypothetical protein